MKWNQKRSSGSTPKANRRSKAALMKYMRAKGAAMSAIVQSAEDEFTTMIKSSKASTKRQEFAR